MAKGTQEGLQKQVVLLRAQVLNCQTVTLAALALAKSCHMAGPDLCRAGKYILPCGAWKEVE